jgi:hypothetical protein
MEERHMHLYAIIPSLPQYGASKFTKDVIRILE